MTASVRDGRVSGRRGGSSSRVAETANENRWEMGLARGAGGAFSGASVVRQERPARRCAALLKLDSGRVGTRPELAPDPRPRATAPAGTARPCGGHTPAVRRAAGGAARGVNWGRTCRREPGSDA